MATAASTILPASYFAGLGDLWGGCVYVGSAIVATGLVFSAARCRPEPQAYLGLITKVFFIGLATAFLRDWLLRLDTIVIAFGDMLGVDPRLVDERFLAFVAGKSAAGPEASAWDVLWGTQSLGTALCYALLWVVGWLAWVVHYLVRLVGDVLLSAGWALSPIFLAFFMLRPMAGVAQRYVIGLVAVVCWPFGWALAAVVTNALLEVAASANLLPVVSNVAPGTMPLVTLLLVGTWMIVSSVLAPWITTKVLLMGVNPAVAFAQGVGGVMQASFAGGVGAAVAAVTGGAAAPAVIAAGAGGALLAGGESTVRGGASARTTGTAIAGMAGFYSGGLARRSAAASEQSAEADSRYATATEAMTDEMIRRSKQASRSKSGFDKQPHDDDPNKSALDI
jgi:type IV secretion system protein TrbL